MKMISHSEPITPASKGEIVRVLISQVTYLFDNKSNTNYKKSLFSRIIYPSESFFLLYVSLNFPYVARLCASNLAKYIKKITSSFGVDYFLPLSLLSNTKPRKNRIQQIINPNFARNLPQIIECMSNIHRD